MTVTFTDLKAKVKEALTACKSTIEAELDNYALSSALAEYAKKAATLAGYGITDAYTKSEVDSKVAAAALARRWTSLTTTPSLKRTRRLLQRFPRSLTATLRGIKP